MHRNTAYSRLLLWAAIGLLTLWGGISSPQSAVAGDPCLNDYWIVTTYRMPQERGACPPQLCFDYFHRPAGQPMHRSSATELQQGLDPNVPTMIFVHGSFVDLDSALADAQFTNRWLRASSGCRMNIICFVWPSSNAESILLPTQVTENGLKAAHNGTYLAHFLNTIQPTRVCLLGHSHGTRVIAAALHFRAGGVIQGRTMNCQQQVAHRIRVVFAAAAINHFWMNPDNRYGLALTQVESLLNLINHRDVALTLYPLASPTYGRAYAKTGATFFDRHQLGPYASRVHEMNVSAMIGVRHVWAAYVERPDLARMLGPFLCFQDCQNGCPQPMMAVLYEHERPELLTHSSGGESRISETRTVELGHMPVDLPLPLPTPLPLPQMPAILPVMPADVPAETSNTAD